MEWGTCWLQPVPPPRALAAEVKKAMGIVPSWTSLLSPVPWVVRAFACVNATQFAHMPPGLWAMIGLVVSQDNSCRYCYGATRMLLKVVGHRDEWIDRIEREVDLAEISPAEQAALHLARKISQANPRPTTDDLAKVARAGFSRAAIAEITYAAAMSCFLNRLATLFALPPESFERWLENPVMRLL